MKKQVKYCILYLRVSRKAQSHASQKKKLEAYAEQSEYPILRISDKGTATKMSALPGQQRLQRLIDAGQVAEVVVYDLSRLGRNVSGLSKLFDEFTSKKINLVSIQDSVNLKTATGRLIANVLASIAQFDSELKGEKIIDGQQASKAKGKKIGGFKKKGTLSKKTAERVSAIKACLDGGYTIKKTSEILGISRPTIYRLMKQGLVNSPKAEAVS